MNRLKDVREDKDLTQREFAKILKISQPSYCDYETEISDIPTKTLLFLSNYYNTSIDYLLYRTDNRNPYLKSKIKRENNENRLKELRGKIKQDEICKIINVTQTGYSKYELGKRDLSTDALKKLADYYNTSIDYILYNTDQIKPHTKSILYK